MQGCSCFAAAPVFVVGSTPSPRSLDASVASFYMLALPPLCAVQGCSCFAAAPVFVVGSRPSPRPLDASVASFYMLALPPLCAVQGCKCFAAAAVFGLSPVFCVGCMVHGRICKGRAFAGSLILWGADGNTIRALAVWLLLLQCLNDYLTAVAWHFHIVASVHALCNCRCDLRTQCAWPATYRFRGDALLGMPLMTSSWFVTFYSAAAGRALLLLGSSRARDSRGFLDPPVMSS